MVDHILEIPEPNVKNVIPHNYVYKQRRYLWLYVYYFNIYLFFSFKQGVKPKNYKFYIFLDLIPHFLDQIFIF